MRVYNKESKILFNDSTISFSIHTIFNFKILHDLLRGIEKDFQNS